MPPKSNKRKVPGPLSTKDVQIKLNTLKANGPPTQPEPARKLTVLPSDPAPNHEVDSDRIATENIEHFDVNKENRSMRRNVYLSIDERLLQDQIKNAEALAEREANVELKDDFWLLQFEDSSISSVPATHRGICLKPTEKLKVDEGNYIIFKSDIPNPVTGSYEWTAYVKRIGHKNYIREVEKALSNHLKSSVIHQQSFDFPSENEYNSQKILENGANRKLQYRETRINLSEGEIDGNDITLPNPGLLFDENFDISQYCGDERNCPSDLANQYSEQLGENCQILDSGLDAAESFINYEEIQAADNSTQPKRSTPAERKTKKNNVVKFGPDELRWLTIETSFKDTSLKMNQMCDKVIDVMSAVENSVKTLDRSVSSMNNRNYNLTHQFVNEMKQLVRFFFY